MRTTTLGILATALLVPTLDAQILRETFNGPNLPANFQVRRGSWAISSGRVQSSTATWAYLTHKSIKLYNCVVEADVYWLGSGVQFGGVAARHDGSGNDNACMVKVQSNSSTVTGFDTLWNYERPGSAVAKTGIAPVMNKTRIRLICLNGNGWLHHDSTQDGIYDTVVGPKVYTAHSSAGEVGVTAYNSGSTPCQIDNFCVYDAVLVEAANAVPKIGTTYNLELHSQQTSLSVYHCALSSTPATKGGVLGGIPVGGGRYVPLPVADPLVPLTIAAASSLGIAGVTDSSGLAKPGLKIPNMSSLVGVDLWMAGVVGAFTTTAGNISNDHHFKIVM